MIDLTKLSRRCRVRVLRDADADAILALCRANTQYYAYCGRQTSREEILRDLHITPPGKTLADKYYVGFFDGDSLVAVMDLIDGYPEERDCFIGFFMMNKSLQGRGIGSEIIGEVCACLGERLRRRAPGDRPGQSPGRPLLEEKRLFRDPSGGAGGRDHSGGKEKPALSGDCS